jgi:hypothetical protein
MGSKNRAGCTCCNTPCVLPVVVTGCCGLPLCGASVTATQGGTTAGPLTTDGSGRVTFSGLAAGAVTIDATHARFSGTQTLATTVTCPTTAQQTLAFGSTAAGGYHCTGACGIPIADTLHFTFAGVARTAVWTDPSPFRWDPFDPHATFGHFYAGWLGCWEDDQATADSTCSSLLTPPLPFTAVEFMIAAEFSGGSPCGTTRAGELPIIQWRNACTIAPYPPDGLIRLRACGDANTDPISGGGLTARVTCCLPVVITAPLGVLFTE